MQITEFIHEERKRGVVYQQLASCYAFPGSELSTTVSNLAAAFDADDQEINHWLTAMQADLEDRAALEIDYARLFVGPFKLLAPPYGSIYLEKIRQVMGDSTLNVLNRYKEAGLQISTDFRDAPDHIAVELEFMFFLIYNGIQALETNEFEKAAEFVKRQAAFLKDHLGAWTPAFSVSVLENATTEFYKNLAQVTTAFMEAELMKIDENLSQLMQIETAPV